MIVEATVDSVYALIRTELIDLGVPEEVVSLEAKFDTMDIDSLDIADMMSAIKSRYGVSIPRAELADWTVGDLAERVVVGASI